MKKAWPYIITIALIILGLAIIFAPSKTSGLPDKPTLFVGQGCPHCKKVEDFVATNGVDKKYSFDTKEVWYNQSNSLIMNQVWQHCGLSSPEGGMSVPLLWDGTTCYSGEVEIINYFQTKLK